MKEIRCIGVKYGICTTNGKLLGYYSGNELTLSIKCPNCKIVNKITVKNGIKKVAT